MPSASAILKPMFGTIAGILGIYLGFISLLTIPRLQDHVIYLHKATLTWFQDVNIPEQWDFLRNQVTRFHLDTRRLCKKIEDRLSFEFLKGDPTAHLVIYFHGAAGTLASGWRPQSYRALSAAVPNLHILAIDYRGYGTGIGWPSESGMLTDALTLANFATKTAGISAERISVFAQSLGTAIALSLSHTLAMETPPTLFAGMILVAPMADVETSTQTYKIAGTIPLLSPMAFYPPLLAFFNRFIVSKWPSKVRIADFIRHLDTVEQNGPKNNYDVTLIHAEDDWDMPWLHSEVLFAHAVHAMHDNATFTPERFEEEKEKRKLPLGAGGWEVEWYGKRGVVREQIVKHGLHDRIMSYPVVSLAVARAFENSKAKDT